MPTRRARKRQGWTARDWNRLDRASGKIGDALDLLGDVNEESETLRVSQRVLNHVARSMEMVFDLTYE